MTYAIGIDVGGTKIAAGVIVRDGAQPILIHCWAGVSRIVGPE